MWSETLKKTGEAVKENVGFVVISIAIIVLVYFIALCLELVIEKKNKVKVRKAETKTNRLTLIGILSALAFVLMIVEVPLWFAPEFYKLDASEIPIMIGAFAMGPCAGVVMEGVKIILKVFIKGTSTAFVGDFANFVIGCMYVVPASFVYHLKKNKKSALIGMLFGTLCMSVAGCVLNAYMLIPTFARLFYLPVDKIVAMGTAVNKNITSLPTLIFFAVFPFNIVKGLCIMVVTTLLYKYVRKVM